MRITSLSLITLVLLGAGKICFGEDVKALPVEIPPTDPAIHYVGRFDRTNPAGPSCGWTASAIVVKFLGTDLNVKFNEDGQDFWQVLVDGKPTSVMELARGEHVYQVAGGMAPGEHLIELVKRTEFPVGTTQFLGFQANEGGKLLPVPEVTRRIEVIGDSISCGYGNEAASEKEGFSPRTENGSIGYGAVAARAVGAEYVCIAISGKKLWPDNTIGAHYEEITRGGKTKWDYSTPAPDAVIINLGTNDFAKVNPEEEPWTKAYKDLIAQVRRQYPKAHIYCALGTMMSEWPPDRDPRKVITGYLQKIVADENAAGDAKVHFLDFGVQKRENGLGANWHPSAKTDQIMGDQLAEALRKDLSWN